MITGAAFVAVTALLITNSVPPASALPAAALLAMALHGVMRPPADLRAVLRAALGPDRGWELPLLWLPRVAVGATALWIVALMAINPAGDLSRYGPQAGAGYTPSLVLCLVLLIAAGIPPFWRLSIRVEARWDRARRIGRVLVGVPIIVLVLALQFAVAIGTSKVPGFDAGGIISSSWEHANSATGFSTDPSDYYSLLPNNAFLGYVLYLGFCALRFFGLTSATATLTAAVLGNALTLSAGAWLTVLVARRLGGTRLSVFLLPALILFVVFSPWLNTPYSDTLGLLFPIASLLCFLQFRDAASTRRRVALLAALGVLAAVGGALKPTTLLPVALIVAAVVIECPPSLRRRTLGALPALAGGAVSAFGLHLLLLAGIGSSGLVHFDVFHNQNALPFTHLMVFGSTGYGGYDQTVAERSIAMPADLRFSRNLDYYFANVSAMHLSGYAAFLGNKALWMLGDGSFFQGREGDTASGWFFSDPVSTTVQSFFPLGTPGHAPLASLWQAGWIVLLGCTALWLVVQPTSTTRIPIAVTQWSLVALVLFLLLSEGRSRYVYLDVPFVILLAGLAVGRLGERIGRGTTSS